MKDSLNKIWNCFLKKKAVFILSLLVALLLTETISSVCTSKQQRSTEVSSLKIQSEDKKQRINTLETTIQNLNQQITLLKFQNESVSQELSSYKDKACFVTQFDQEKQALQKTIHSLKKQNTHLKQKNIILQKKYNTTTCKVKELRKQIKFLNKTLSCTSQTTQKQLTKKKANSTKQDDASVMVHVTQTGKKYHKQGCSYLRYSDHKISLKTAKENGYIPCQRCYG